MSDQIEVDKPPITPIYSQDEPNQPIDLGQVAVQLECKGTSYRNKANVKMEFLQKHDLQFIVPLEGENLCCDLISVGRKLKLTLPERNITEDFFCAAIGGKHGGIVFSPARSGITVTQSSSTISTAIFHLFNFPDFWAPEDHSLRTAQSPVQCDRKCRRAILKANGWIITIAEYESNI
jgi:hypothetical protein